MAGDGESRRSLPVEVKSGEEPVLILNEHKIERAKAVGWEFLPAGHSCKGLATYDGLLVISGDEGQPGSLDELAFGEALAATKEAYERRHPETRRAACGGGRNGKGTRRKTGLSAADTPVPRFTLHASQVLGVGETRIKELIRCANKLKGDARKEFAGGEITRSEALRRLGPANGKGTPRGRHSLARAIHSLERALQKTSDVSDKDRARLDGLVVMIHEVLGGPVEELPVLTEDGAVKLPMSRERR